MIECSITELHAKVQGSHRQFTDTQRRPSTPERTKEPQPRRSYGRERGRGRVWGHAPKAQL